MTIQGDTIQEKYRSMYTGDCSNTDFGKVMELLKGLKKFPEYLIVLSDMEFDQGSNQSKKETMELFKRNGANTKIIWWNLNERNKTVPEFDEYGNIFLSGYNLQILKLLENKFDMSTYIEKILEKYKKDIDYKN
jgi:DNA mismatch repair ATPase MutS